MSDLTGRLQAVREAVAAVDPAGVALVDAAVSGLPLPATSTTPGGDALRDAVDAVLDAAWRGRDADHRTALGQVWTPRAVARQVLLEVGLPAAPAGVVLDPSCGGGVFLAEALRMKVAAGSAVALALAELRGVDIDPEAAMLARAVVAAEVVALGGLDASCAVGVAHGDGLDHHEPARWVVGNPPYLEAKRMPKPERVALRARFDGRLAGAWDLYVAFLEHALELAGPDGHVGFVLPNKVQVARYAEGLRARLLAQGRVRAVVDLSELPVFAQVGVYPVVLVAGPGAGPVRVAHRVGADVPLGVRALATTPVPAGVWAVEGPGNVWFTVPDASWASVLGQLTRAPVVLDDVAEVRSTCSFHVKGLRERFVRPAAELGHGLPYLGGQSYLRKLEVDRFAIDDLGYRIDFDEEALRAARNPLPPRALFLGGPKVIFRQHALGLVAAVDEEGVWVTKDVYPLVVPRPRDARHAWAVAGVLNSRVATAIYAVRHRGIQIGGRYLHVLPVWLKRMPWPTWDDATVTALAETARAVAGGEAHRDELDRLVGEGLGLSAEAVAMLAAHGAHVEAGGVG